MSNRKAGVWFDASSFLPEQSTPQGGGPLCDKQSLVPFIEYPLPLPPFSKSLLASWVSARSSPHPFSNDRYHATA